MNDDKILRARLIDLANKSYQNNIYTYTNFLSLGEMSILEECKSDISFSGYEIFEHEGNLERRMVRFGNEALLGYSETWPIKVIKVEPLAEKFAEKLTHRDFLGAIMNLGIERNILGDIFVKDEKRAYIYCVDSIADYIHDELSKIRHTNVKCLIMNVDDEACINDLKPTLVDVQCIVAAPRFDAVVAAVTKVSRNEAHNLFRSGKISKNGMICENNSDKLKEGDIFSVRGYGKYIFKGITATTKKGRTMIKLQQYK